MRTGRTSLLRRGAACLLGLALVVTLFPAPVHASCAQHGDRSHEHHAADARGHSAGAAAVQQAQESCDHCQSRECAMASSCGGSSPTLLTTRRPASVPTPALHAQGRPWLPIHLLPSSPPTPPPTRLL